MHRICFLFLQVAGYSQMMSVQSSSGLALQRDDVCSYQFRPRSSDNKKSVRVSALYLRRKRNLLYPLYIDIEKEKYKNIKPIKTKNISIEVVKWLTVTSDGNPDHMLRKVCRQKDSCSFFQVIKFS